MCPPMRDLPRPFECWQYRRMWRVLLLSAAVAFTKPAPGVCCLDPNDCASINVFEESRECETGLACVDHVCQPPTCLMEGCGTDAPVCDTRIDVCTGCTDSSQCDRFAGELVCG
jgi:hypothetical protein